MLGLYTYLVTIFVYLERVHTGIVLVIVSGVGGLLAPVLILTPLIIIICCVVLRRRKKKAKKNGMFVAVITVSCLELIKWSRHVMVKDSGCSNATIPLILYEVCFLYGEKSACVESDLQLLDVQ